MSKEPGLARAMTVALVMPGLSLMTLSHNDSSIVRGSDSVLRNSTRLSIDSDMWEKSESEESESESVAEAGMFTAFPLTSLIIFVDTPTPTPAPMLLSIATRKRGAAKRVKMWIIHLGHVDVEGGGADDESEEGPTPGHVARAQQHAPSVPQSCALEGEREGGSRSKATSMAP